MDNCKLWYLKTIVFQNCIHKHALRDLLRDLILNRVEYALSTVLSLTLAYGSC
jgi:hypothetical protein